MEYNSQREKLLIPEYGRNLQKMIQLITTMENRERRTRMAHVIVDIMAQIHSPQMKDTTDLRQKLWDHLHIMADFELDVDSPFPVPDREVLSKAPNRIDYPKGAVRYNYYGRNIQLIIQKAIDMPSGPEKDALIVNIANNMKKAYLTWNRDSVDDQLIADHLEELSHHELHLPENQQLSSTQEILGRNNVKQKKIKPPKGHNPNRRKNK